VGDGPAEVIVSPDGKKAYVACNFSDDISVIDLTTWKVAGAIKAGKFADGLAWVK
jgi:YVTN family beta-propeller protein